MRRLLMSFTASLILVFGGIGMDQVIAQPVSPPAFEVAPNPIVIGETIVLPSKILTEPREINVYLPSDYREGARTYPVLYLIDGGVDQDFLHIAGTVHLGALWARSRSAIVVGITTKDRRHELTGKTHDAELLKQYPTSGASSRFRAFIRDEVMPMIESRYRVSDESAVIGESLAGLFVVETFLREPAMFDRYAAISPSLWWDDGRLAASAKKLIAQVPRGDIAIYLAMADEGSETSAAMQILLDALSSKKQWCYSPQSHLTHATIYHSVSPEALQFLLPTAQAPDPRGGFRVECKVGHVVP